MKKTMTQDLTPDELAALEGLTGPDWKARAQAAEGSLARVNEWTRAELAAVHAEYSALLDQAREVVTDLVRFAGEVIGCQDAPNRGDWGVECPLCMGELVEQQDRDLTDAATLFLTRLSKTGGEEKQELSPSRTSPSSPDSRRPEALSDLEGELLAALKALLADSYPVGCDENMEVREQAIAAIAKAEHQQ